MEEEKGLERLSSIGKRNYREMNTEDIYREVMEGIESSKKRLRVLTDKTDELILLTKGNLNKEFIDNLIQEYE